ncbi:nucleotidyltransferase domain-containing protein [Thiohalorhabdus sp.]|uniref:nucleotidyltransferase domain-containing protein n=1 Tax=Thiohalorhabdus sp. TaxID=3094134 RepID=UPI002FC3A45B
MRLAPHQVQTIKGEVHSLLGEDARVWLFGSRADDAARGGDIDLFVETDRPIANRAETASRLAARLQLRLGDQRIDVVLVDPQTQAQPIHSAAKETGVPL